MLRTAPQHATGNDIAERTPRTSWPIDAPTCLGLTHPDPRGRPQPHTAVNLPVHALQGCTLPWTCILQSKDKDPRKRQRGCAPRSRARRVGRQLPGCCMWWSRRWRARRAGAASSLRARTAPQTTPAPALAAPSATPCFTWPEWADPLASAGTLSKLAAPAKR